MRQIRMLRAMRRELETGLRRLLHGQAGGNPDTAKELPTDYRASSRPYHVRSRVHRRDRLGGVVHEYVLAGTRVFRTLQDPPFGSTAIPGAAAQETRREAALSER